jgi:PKD repeat protein
VNHAPTSGLNATPKSGVAPLQVNFTLNGTDADADSLNWTLVFGDGSTNATGKTLPSVVAHTYAAAGKFNATLIVRDGTLQTKSNVTIAITAGGGGGAAPLFTFAEATTIPANPGMTGVPELGSAGAAACGSFSSGQSGGDCVFTVLTPNLAGHLFTGTSSGANADLEFWDACDWAGGTFVGDLYANAGSESGTVPAGAGCVILWDSAAPATLTFTVTA